MLCDDAALADRLGASGKAFVARTYTWPRIVQTYLDMFAEVRTRNAERPSTRNAERPSTRTAYSA